MKDQIIELRKQGKSYREIQKYVKCSRSLISYHLNPEGRTKSLERNNKNRFRIRKSYKDLAGGCCHYCKYNKCYNALQFHHLNPKEKKFNISDVIFDKGKASHKEILEEIKKCILVCANCHAELHSYNK